MKVRNVLIIVLIIILIIVLKNYVFYDRYKMPKGAEIKTIQKQIEVYDESAKLYDFIGDNNVEILTEDLALDTEKVGIQKETIEYKYKGIRKYKYNVEYEVVDNVAPIFITGLSATKNVYVNEVTQEDIDKMIQKITYADNYDVYPKLEVDENIDFNTVGKYEVKLTLSDSSGNKTIKEIEVNVKERPTKTENTENSDTNESEEEEDKGIPFEDHITNYKTDNTMVGIDISKWQGEVDFKKVKEAGCEFVIIRLGVMKDKDSELAIDKTFETNYKNAKSAGLKVGIYVYSEANNVETAISNAEFVINKLDGGNLDFPVAFDWESWTYFNSMEMNLHMLNKMYNAFRDTLKEAGYDTMLYASENYLNNAWMDLEDYKIWVAKYSSKTPYISNEGNSFLIWQCANTGRIDGIDGDVDLDIYYK